MLGKLFLILAGYLLIRMVIYYFRARKVFTTMIDEAKRQQQKNPKPEGEITITYKPGKDKKNKDGDYVDYKEVD